MGARRSESPDSALYLPKSSSQSFSYADLELFRQPLGELARRGELDRLVRLLSRIGRAEDAPAWKRDARRALAQLLAAAETDAGFRWSVPGGDGIAFECQRCGRPDEIRRAPRSGKSNRLRWVRWEGDQHRPFVVCAACGKQPKPFARCAHEGCESLAAPHKARCMTHLSAEPPVDRPEEGRELAEWLYQLMNDAADRWLQAPRADAKDLWAVFDRLANEWLEHQLGLDFDLEVRQTQLALAEVKLTGLSAIPFADRIVALQRKVDAEPRWSRLRALHGIADGPILLVRLGELDTSGDEI